MLALLFAGCTLAPAEPVKETHDAQNPLYKSLLDPGLSVGADVKAKFPAPTMPDGLDAAKQKAIITNLIGNDYTYEDFTRKSVVAPQLLKLRDVSPSDPKAPARGADVWFIAHGDLKALDDDKFLDRLVNVGKGEGKGKGLTKEDLAKRKIPLPDEKREGYGHIEFDFLEKVHLKATGRAVWTRGDESVLVAAEIDPRFRGDAVFPNQWQSIIKEGGTTKLGPAHPWDGAGFYLKITKLSEPAGALFCEQHVIFAEPTGWFEGANLLRSKLPLVVQNNVRTMRKEWMKGPGKK
jgi:hypothetical protein